MEGPLKENKRTKEIPIHYVEVTFKLPELRRRCTERLGGRVPLQQNELNSPKACETDLLVAWLTRHAVLGLKPGRICHWGQQR